MPLGCPGTTTPDLGTKRDVAKSSLFAQLAESRLFVALATLHLAAWSEPTGWGIRLVSGEQENAVAAVNQHNTGGGPRDEPDFCFCHSVP
jgi:hypothetical protein